MPSAAANAKLEKPEKPAAPEASDNSPVRQVLVIIEHKIRNLEKRKSKLVSYRDLQKSGKELNADQKVAVAKYDEVAQTLEFARDLYKQISIIATTSERDAKRQAKRDARALSANETNKIRDIICILDCLSCMGSEEARNDFLAGTNGAATLTSEDLRILDDIYPEVTPKHEVAEQGLPSFQMEALKAAEHLLAIVDSRPKEVVGTTYARIKEIVNTIHQCGYFEHTGDGNQVLEEPTDVPEEAILEQSEPVIVDMMTPMVLTAVPMAMAITAPALSPPTVISTVPTAAPVLPAPAAAAVPAPTFPMMPVAPVTLQEVEHAYFSQQYVQQPRPIAEVIGSQNFYFLQESELDSPTATPQPPARRPSSPSTPVQSQTYTNQSFSAPQPRHFPPELRPNALIPSAEIQPHFPNAAGEVPRGPPFAVSPMQINPMAIPRAPLAVPPTQATQPLPIHVALTTQTGVPYIPTPVENAPEDRQSTHVNPEITTEDNGWGETITVAETDEWRESPEPAEDRRDRPRGDPHGDNRGDPRGDSRGPPKYRGRGRGAPRGGPPRNNYQNGRNGNSQYRNGDGYQNGGGNFRERDNNQGGGNYRERDNNQGGGSYRERDSNQGGGNYRERDSNQGGGNYRERENNQAGGNYRERDSNSGGGNYRERDNNQGSGNYRERDSNQGGGNYRERDNNQGGGSYRESQQGSSGYQGYKSRGRGAPVGTRGSGGRGRGVAPRGTSRPNFARKSPVRE